MKEDNARFTLHPAHVRLRSAAWRERSALVRALGIEFDWRYHDGPEWAGRYYDAFGDLEQTRACSRARRLQAESIQRYRRKPVLDHVRASEMRTLFRHLLTCLHPDVVPAAAGDRRAGQWAQVCEAYRRGDFVALERMARQVDNHVYANGLRMPVPRLRHEYQRLRSMRKVADSRLSDMAQRFPWCLRDKLDDGRWVARKRLAWGQMLAIAAPDRLSGASANIAGWPAARKQPILPAHQLENNVNDRHTAQTG